MNEINLFKEQGLSEDTVTHVALEEMIAFGVIPGIAPESIQSFTSQKAGEELYHLFVSENPAYTRVARTWAAMATTGLRLTSGINPDKSSRTAITHLSGLAALMYRDTDFAWNSGNIEEINESNIFEEIRGADAAQMIIDSLATGLSETGIGDISGEIDQYVTKMFVLFKEGHFISAPTHGLETVEEYNRALFTAYMTLVAKIAYKADHIPASRINDLVACAELMQRYIDMIPEQEEQDKQLYRPNYATAYKRHYKNRAEANQKYFNKINSLWYRITGNSKIPGFAKDFMKSLPVNMRDARTIFVKYLLSHYAIFASHFSPQQLDLIISEIDPDYREKEKPGIAFIQKHRAEPEISLDANPEEVIKSETDVRNYLRWGARALPATLPWQQLQHLEPFNNRCLDVLTQSNKQRQQECITNNDFVTVIIPASNESGIGITLSDVTTQLSHVQSQGFCEDYEVIVAINNENVSQETTRAVEAFNARNKSGKHVRIVYSEKPGKLSAFNTVFEEMYKKKEVPGALYFFDADVRLMEGCILGMGEQLQAGNAVSAARVVLDETRRDIVSEISKMPMQLEHLRRNSTWITGGAFAIDSDIIPLYKAFCECFPGLYAVDSNFGKALAIRNIPFGITDKKLITVEPVSEPFTLIKQFDRWFKGIRQGNGITHNKNELSLLSNAVQMARGFFPEFPRIQKEEIDRFFKLLPGSTGIAPLIAMQFLLIDKGINIFVSSDSGLVGIGGFPPNPFIPKGWHPPR